MVIRALDLVRQCYSQDDGQKVFDVLLPRLKRGERIELSFDGVDTVPSSFINTALIHLLDVLPFETIKSSLRFVNTTRQINDMIKSRFDFEVNRRHLLPTR
jgi:hypothetical protein